MYTAISSHNDIILVFQSSVRVPRSLLLSGARAQSHGSSLDSCIAVNTGEWNFTRQMSQVNVCCVYEVVTWE